MTQLPIANVPDPKRGRRIVVHSGRVLMFLTIFILIRFANRQTEFVDSHLASNETAIEFVKTALPGATRIGPFDSGLGGNVVTNSANEKVGFVIQTSPASDSIIGYSGPTNCLIALNLESKIQATAVLSSGDTFDHVALVRQHQPFLDSFQGFGFESSNPWQDIDGVSSATLTSYAIIAAVANRISGSAPSLKFTAKPNLKKVTRLLPATVKLEPAKRDGLWNVFDADGKNIGYVLSTTPTADHLSGYQGPTATLIGFDESQKCVGVVVDQTYENEPYATYLDDDRFFQKLYLGRSLVELAAMVPEDLGIEGVSGATMTSMTVADGIPLAASAALASKTAIAAFTRSPLTYWADLLTILLTLLGVAFSFTKLSRRKWCRLVYQFAVVALLGFLSGHMFSQAALAGWSAHSIPWNVAPGLVFLSIAALLVPMVSKHQPYCQHICPFGALQQLGRSKSLQRRIGWKVHIPSTLSRVLQWIPYALLAFVVVATISHSTSNLAGIEPFDAFDFRVAGWATIAIFVVGLLFSLVSPMAYCRFGCPTGAMLNFLKFRADSDQLGTRDFAAAGLLAVAILLLSR